jgi:integrase
MMTGLAMKIDIKHINTVKKTLSDGTTKTYYYHRRTNRRIEGIPGSKEFLLSYQKACKVERKYAKTFNNLICNFFESQKFSSLSLRTRGDYHKQRSFIVDKWGNLPLGVLEDPRVKGNFRKWRDELSKKKGAKQADAILGLARRIVSFAKDDGLIAVNHLMDIQALYSADRSEIIWLPKDVDAFFQHANPGMQLALILALNLGRREADLIRLTWGDYNGETILVTNRKSGRANKFPARVTSGLAKALDAYKASLERPPLPQQTILTKPRAGTPWGDKQFSDKFSKAKNESGLKHLHFHDLRGTAVTVLAQEGCTDMQIASITGHSLKHVSSILDKYMARTQELNVAATKRLEETWIAKLRMR